MLLSDTQWLLLQPLFARSSPAGRPSLDDRLVLELVLLKLTSHRPWYDLPVGSPSCQTCYQRYHKWHHTGLWNCILRTLICDLDARGGFDLLMLWEEGLLKIKQRPSGQFALVCPPGFEGTWQASTALNLLLALSAEQ